MERESLAKTEIDRYKQVMQQAEHYSTIRGIAKAINVNEDYLYKVFRGMFFMKPDLQRRLQEHFQKLEINTNSERH